MPCGPARGAVHGERAAPRQWRQRACEAHPHCMRRPCTEPAPLTCVTCSGGAAACGMALIPTCNVKNEGEAVGPRARY